MGVDKEFDRKMSDFRKLLGNDRPLPLVRTTHLDEFHPGPLCVHYVPQTGHGLLRWGAGVPR